MGIPNLTDDRQTDEPQHLTQTLHRTVTGRWPEIANFALRNCADGYARGYVLLKGPDAPLEYIAVPDRKQTVSETQRPWTLEEAVLTKDNCEAFIVVALQMEGALIWRRFAEVNEQSIYDAAEAFSQAG